MTNQKLTDLMIEQINKELYSGYLYLGISAFYAARHLDGFAHWFKKQADEEKEHAEKFIDYLTNQGIEIKLEPITGVATDYEDEKAPLLFQLKHEKYVTSLIEKLYDLAEELVDRRAIHFLDYFIDEQKEEEENAARLILDYERLATDSQGLALLDGKLAAR